MDRLKQVEPPVDEALRRRGRGRAPVEGPRVGPGRDAPDPRREGRVGGLGRFGRAARAGSAPTSATSASSSTSTAMAARSTGTSARGVSTRGSTSTSRRSRACKHFREFLNEAGDLVVSYGGSISGEHGDGQSKAALLPKMFGDELVRAFGEFKAIWDPDNRMNPHKVVDPYLPGENLRLGPHYHPPQLATHFSFPDDKGSFSYATERCVGIGECRKEQNGTMCPSYMVTKEEMHSTRGRAHLLFEMFQGDPMKEGWNSKPVREALDLCLACKGCRTECPMNVDMATYKAEFLSHYYEGRLRPRHAYAMGWIYWWARLASIAPADGERDHAHARARRRAQVPGRDLEPAGDARRSPRDLQGLVPSPARAGTTGRPGSCSGPTRSTTISTRRRRSRPSRCWRPPGFEVVVPQRSLCCGRPLYDFGMLKTAKKLLRQILDTLRPEIEAGTPVVGLEPSCVAVFRDELHQPVPDGRGRQAALGQHLHPERVPGEEGARLPAAEAAPQGDRAEALPPRPRDGLPRGRRAPEEARARLRDPQLGLLRDGRVVRLRVGALRHLGRRRRARPAPRGAGGRRQDTLDPRRRLQLPRADRRPDRPRGVASRPGPADGTPRGARRARARSRPRRRYEPLGKWDARLARRRQRSGGLATAVRVSLRRAWAGSRDGPSGSAGRTTDMAGISAEPGSAQQQTKVHEIDGVQVYGRKGPEGRSTILDAIDEDEEKIGRIADRLQRRGYGVMRQRHTRAGRGLSRLQGDLGRAGRPAGRPVQPGIDGRSTAHEIQADS